MEPRSIVSALEGFYLEYEGEEGWGMGRGKGEGLPPFQRKGLSHPQVDGLLPHSKHKEGATDRGGGVLPFKQKGLHAPSRIKDKVVVS